MRRSLVVLTAVLALACGGGDDTGAAPVDVEIEHSFHGIGEAEGPGKGVPGELSAGGGEGSLPQPADPAPPIGGPVASNDGSGPAKVVEDWLRAGGRGDLAASQALVTPECKDEPFGRASPAQVMGVPVSITTLSTSTSQEAGDEAVVHYALTGSAKGGAGKTKTKLFGVDVEVDVDALSIDSYANEGDVNLVRRGGAWLVACP